MKAAAIAVVAAAAISSAAAFAPSINGSVRVSSSLSATSDRRDAIGNIAKLMGGALLTVAGADPAAAASNPALNGWRGKGKGGGDGTFVPGKGMREKQSYDDLMAASNPALSGWRGKGKARSSVSCCRPACLPASRLSSGSNQRAVDSTTRRAVRGRLKRLLEFSGPAGCPLR